MSKAITVRGRRPLPADALRPVPGLPGVVACAIAGTSARRSSGELP